MGADLHLRRPLRAGIVTARLHRRITGRDRLRKDIMGGLLFLIEHLRHRQVLHGKEEIVTRFGLYFRLWTKTVRLYDGWVQECGFGAEP